MITKNYTYRKIDIGERGLAVSREWFANHKPEFYDIDTSRERMSKALANTRAYHLRVPDMPKNSIVKTTSAQNVLLCRDTVMVKTFPVMMNFINWVGQELYGGWNHLGRVFVTQLQSNSVIGRHVDEGVYFDSLHRHHFILDTKGSLFCWDNDEVMLENGELWVVNNSVPHWVENFFDAPRTHVIFDGA